MEFPPDKCTLGLQGLLEDSYRIFTILPYLWDRGHQPNRTVRTPRVVLEEIEGYADDTQSKGRLVDLEGLKEKQEVATRRSQRYQ